jgi:epoxyqueuosine reductase QueG
MVSKPTKAQQIGNKKLEKEGQKIEGFARDLGAEIYGVASAEAFNKFPKKPQPSKFVPDARSVIIVGMPFTPEIYATVAKPWLAGISRKGGEEAGLTDKTLRKPPAGVERYFMGDENTILSHEVGLMAYKIAWKLHREGEQAFYFPGPFKQDPRFRTTAFQFTPAMYLAGIGQMGFNCSILTPEFGPRIWITAIITTKDLPPGQPIEPVLYEECKDCKECVKRCPSTSLDGKGWKNVFRCAAYGCCGTCLSVCPIGNE